MNIVLMTVDTVRADRLGCYGYDRPTPNIDSLARAGVLFEQAISNGTYTKSAFPPILSSTYASMCGGPFHSVGTRRPMLAKVLRGHGFRTAGFTSNPLLGANVGYEDGFERFAEPVPPAEDRRWLRLKGSQRLLSYAPANRLLMALGLDTSVHPVYVDGDRITDLGLEWVRQTSQPFFLWLHYMDAHWPYHDLSSMDGASERAQAWRDRRLMSRSRRTYPGKKVVERLSEMYDAAIRRVDEQIGRVVSETALQESSGQTAVIVLSDHGEAFYEHGRWQHGAVFDFHEEVLRVPLIMKAPGLPKSHRVTELVSLIDVAPTILELGGLEAPARMEGQSLLSLIGGQQEGPALVISEMVDLDWYCVALRTERFKYVYDERRPESRLLFDLKNDPAETDNLHGSQPELEFEFEVRLQKHLEQIGREGGRATDGAWQVEGDVVRRLKSLGYLE